MNKIQNISIIITLFLAIFAVIYPPYLEIRNFHPSLLPKVIMKKGLKSGWTWFFSLKPHLTRNESGTYINSYKIRYDILTCELLIVALLGCILFILSKKRSNYQ